LCQKIAPVVRLQAHHTDARTRGRTAFVSEGSWGDCVSPAGLMPPPAGPPALVAIQRYTRCHLPVTARTPFRMSGQSVP
jgi:hypothetical protein